MKLNFTKRDGKFDDLLIERSGEPAATMKCPKQGIIPHDMVHFAVESTLAQGGFLALVADGREASFTTTGGDAEEAVERLVENFQAEMWGGRVSAEDLIGSYEQSCAARGHAAVPVSAADVEKIRTRLDELTAQWSAVPLNGSLIVELLRQSEVQPRSPLSGAGAGSGAGPGAGCGQ
jgi:hypothetical protein